MTEQLQQLDKLASYIRSVTEELLNEQPKEMTKEEEEVYSMAIGMHRMAFNTQVTLKNIRNSSKE